MNILTGNVTIKRIWQLLKKTVTSADLANYSVAIDNKNDSDTKRIPLDELRIALMNSGLLDYRGDYDASVNLYPASGGSGTGGAILKANAWIVSVGGTIDGNAVIPGQILMAKIDNPGQTSANWFISLAAGNITFTPTTDTTSTNVQSAIEEVQTDALYEVIEVACSDLTTNNAAATNVAEFHMPFTGILEEVISSLDTQCTGSTHITDINLNGTSVLSTKLSIDASENNSLTAATPAVISTTEFTKGDKVSIDRDQVGATIAGKGHVVTLKFRRS